MRDSHQHEEESASTNLGQQAQFLCDRSNDAKSWLEVDSEKQFEMQRLEPAAVSGHFSKQSEDKRLAKPVPAEGNRSSSCARIRSGKACWRQVLIRTLVGLFIGFSGQLVLDFFSWNFRPYPPNRTMYDYFFCGTSDHNLVNQSFEGWLTFEFRNAPGKKNQARVLYSELLFLHWLKKRWELAGQTAIVVGLVGASSVLFYRHQLLIGGTQKQSPEIPVLEQQ